MSTFFIVGVQRSGTTMLSVLLGNHSDILMEEKVTAFRLISSYENMNELLPFNLDLKEEEFTEWIIKNDSTERLKNFFHKYDFGNTETYRESIEYSKREKLRQQQKKVWGDKAPNLQHYITELLFIIPEAKFIHIVRDGRAVAASMNERSYRNLKVCAQMWVDGNVCGLVNQKVLGESKYKIVRYEDLLRNPKDTMKSICTFLNIEYQPEMIDLSSQASSEKDYVKNYYDESKIDAWKSSLSSSKIKTIEEIQIKALEAFNYEVQHVNYKPLKLRQKLFLMQIDNWRNLFRRRKKGMKDRQIIEYNDSFRSRFKRFVLFYGVLFLSKEINKKIFSRYNYKHKTKRKTPDSQ